MRKIIGVILLLNSWISIFANEDIYRNILYFLYQSELTYQYGMVTKEIEKALSKGNSYHEFIVVEDYSKMPNVDTEINENGIDPYKMYYDTMCNFQDSIGVYVAMARYSDADNGLNIIKDGERIWYYNRNLQGQQMASVMKLWQFCHKHKYNTKQMLYMMGAFILANGDRNTCPFREFTYDINYINRYLKTDRNVDSTFFDLLNNRKMPSSELITTSPCFVKVNSKFEGEYLIFYSGDSIYYSPNTIRYQFGFLRKAYLLYLHKAITQIQLLNLLQSLVLQE